MFFSTLSPTFTKTSVSLPCSGEPISFAALAFLLLTTSILELYFDLFLNEVEHLLRQGLLKAYQRKEGNLSSLKGRLIFQKHLHQNLSHQERFYTNHEKYDYAHILNQVILKGLFVLKKLLNMSY